MTKSVFVICFNTFNLKISSQESQGATVEWSSTGQWLGRDAFVGWDGGALVSTPSHLGNESLPPPIRLPSRSSLTSILRKGADSGETVDPLLQRGKKTQFTGKHSERVFFPDRMTLEQETLVATKILQPVAATEADQRLIEAISEAVKRNSSADLIRCLQSGTLCADLDHSMWSFLSKQLDIAQRENIADRRIMDVLCIYKRAFKPIAMAQNLRSWRQLRVHVEKIVDFSLTAEGEQKLDAKTLKCFLFHRIDNKPTKLPSLPPMDMGEVIDYGRGNAAVPVYDLFFNPAERHLLRVELHSTTAKLNPRVDIAFEEMFANIGTRGSAPKTLIKALRVSGSNENLVREGVKIQLKVEEVEVDRGMFFYESLLCDMLDSQFASTSQRITVAFSGKGCQRSIEGIGRGNFTNLSVQLKCPARGTEAACSHLRKAVLFPSTRCNHICRARPCQ
jgi:hypothetical protein